MGKYYEPNEYFSDSMKKILDKYKEEKKPVKTTKKPAEKKPAPKKK